jgi:hypothetical protein
MAKSDYGKKARSTGIGESKRFIAPGGENDPERDAFKTLKGLHMGGKPVEEVIPRDQVHLITFDHTDEGIAKRNEDRVKTGIEPGKDALAKAIEKHGDSIEPWENTDPAKYLTDKYVKPGERPRLLSERMIDHAGTRGFEIVKDKNGDPVKLGNMPLGVMPEEKARKRQKYFEDLSRENIRDAEGDLQVKQERLIRDSGGEAAPLSPGEAIQGTTAEGYGGKSRAGEVLHAPQSARTGLQSHRGNSRHEE